MPAHVAGPLLVEEVPDDGEVQHHEGGQGAEVDQAADGVDAELLKDGHEDDGEDTHEQSRNVGGLVGGMNLGQYLGHHAVTRHGKQDAADGGLSGQGVEDTPGDGGCQGAQAVQELATGDRGNQVEAVIRVIGKDGTVGAEATGDIGLSHEEHAHQHEGANHGAAGALLGVLGLLGKGRDGVEAHEGQAAQGHSAHDEGQAEGLRVVEGLQGEAVAHGIGGQPPDAHDEEDAENQQLAHKRDAVQHGSQLDAADVDEGVDEHKQKAPHNGGNLGHQAVHGNGGHDVQQGGNQQVVEHHCPAAHEAPAAADATAAVTVDRAGHGELLR